MSLATVALFVYNRPSHTRQTVEALLMNQLAKVSDLIIFSDAPKSEEQAEAVLAVRDYIHKIEGFKSVTIIEREKNFGLARSIIEGVTSVVNECGRIIVLEDDLVVAPHFLDFMNEALEVYAGEDRVMHISGYMYPTGNTALPETIFLRVSSCWGWATWARAWNAFNPDAQNLLDTLRAKKLEYEFDVHGAVSYVKMLQNQASDGIDSWAIRWYASVFLNGGLCLHPAISLVRNIGHDGTGVHCGSSTMYDVPALNVKPIIARQDITESVVGRESIRKFYRSFMRPFHIRVYAALTRRLKRLCRC